jgi:hypothetical protein
MSDNPNYRRKRLPKQAHREGMEFARFGELFDIPLLDLHEDDVRAALGIYSAKVNEMQREIARLSSPQATSSGLILPPGVA